MKWHVRALWWRIQFAVTPERASGKARTLSLSGKTTPSFFREFWLNSRCNSHINRIPFTFLCLSLFLSAPNIVRNQRYNLLTLVPLVLYDQFR